MFTKQHSIDSVVSLSCKDNTNNNSKLINAGNEFNLIDLSTLLNKIKINVA